MKSDYLPIMGIASNRRLFTRRAVRPNGWHALGALLVVLGAAVAVFLTSDYGKQLIGFGRESVREVKKVVWPARKEAMQMTAYVFAFVFVMSLFLWLTDKTLEWVLYDLVLGWR